MAQPDFGTTPTLRVVAPKPRMTIYFALLIIALVAMLTACLFLYLEIRRYGGFGAIQGRVSAVHYLAPSIVARSVLDRGHERA
jgi:hypothetical protein